MEAIVITWRELLLLVCVILAIYIAEMLLLMRAGGGLRKPRWLGLITERQANAEMLARIEALTQRVAALEARIPSESDAPPLAATSPYHRSIQLAQQGLTAAQIAESCGISRGEAELIVSLHQTQAP